MSQEFAQRAEHIIDAMLESEPLAAQEVGDHRFDGTLEDLSSSGVAARVSMLLDASNALADVDTEALTPDEHVDWETLSNAVAQRLFMLSEVKEHEWDVLRHSPAPLIEPLITRPFAPAEERLTALLNRLESIPDAVAASKHTLTRVPKLHAVLGAAQFRSTAELAKTGVAQLSEGIPGAKSKADPIVDSAAEAMTDFAAWLDDVETGHSPRLGRKLWEGKLWLTLDTQMSAQEILDKTSRWIAELTAQLAETSAQYLTENGKSTDGNVIEEASALAASDRTNGITALDMAQSIVEETRGFVTDKNLVSLIDSPLSITEMPDSARGLAEAYCEPPGVYEKASMPGYFKVATPPNSGSAEIESYYRENNEHMLRALTAHEVVPGHHLQSAHARRYRGATRARAVCASGTFLEGWAVYVEEMMAANGYGGTAFRMQQLQRQLRMVVDAVIDQLTHCEDFTGPDAADLLQGHGRYSPHAAEMKWARALLTSTHLSTYFVGYNEMSAIAYSRPSSQSDRMWHDRMLAHSTVAPRHLATLLEI